MPEFLFLTRAIFLFLFLFILEKIQISSLPMKINPIEWEVRWIRDVKKFVHADKAKVQSCECKLKVIVGYRGIDSNVMLKQQN